MIWHHAMECFIQKGDKFLILHRSPHKKIMPDVCMAPGGHVEDEESLFEATRREIVEETGVEITNLRLKATGNAIVHDLDSRLIVNFLRADYVSGEPPLETVQDGKFYWLTLAEILALPTLLAELKEVLPLILQPETEDSEVLSFYAEYSEGNNLVKFRLDQP